MTVRIAVVGAGQIGRRHVEAVQAARGAALAAVVEPAEAGRAVGEAAGVPWLAALEALLEAKLADAVILATPNALHAEGGLACLKAGLPVLVEKPLAASVADGERLVIAARDAGLVLMTGHHRRHNPLIIRAKAVLEEGALGQLVAVHGQTWFRKPDDYFDTDWRRQPGAGPIFLNLVHDIDLLQYFCGPVAEVHAMESNAFRGYAVEETAVILLRFASGLLGTVNVCDAASAPWSWELTARENPAYPATDQNSYLIGGSEGSLALPNLTLWRHDPLGNWMEPIAATKVPFGLADPLVMQVENFVAAVKGEAEPRITGEDGLSALKVVAAVKASAQSGETVRIV